MDNQRKVNISVIAEKAGVSRATVSRVLTNRGNVRLETRERVEDVMKELGYVPNIMARGLATGKLNIVGLVVDLGNPFFNRLISSISSALQAHGYLITVISLGAEASFSDYQAVFSYGYSGLIIVDPPKCDEFGQLLARTRLPVVLLNQNAEYYHDCDTIIIDNFKGGYAATKHLLDLGHRHIAMLRGMETSTASNNRFEGYLQALGEFGVLENLNIVSLGDFTIERGEAFASYILEKHAYVSAIFAGNDYMAMGVLNVCTQRRVSVPSQLSVLGISSTSLSGIPIIDMTCIQQPYRTMGKQAVWLLVERIEKNDHEIQNLILSPRIQEGGTTGPHSAQAQLCPN